LEVIIWIIILWFIFSMVKGKLERDSLREVINNIRVEGLRNPMSFLESFDSDELEKLYNSNEKELKYFIGHTIVTSLKMSGYKTEWIKGNVKLSHLLSQTVKDIANETLKELNTLKVDDYEQDLIPSRNEEKIDIEYEENFYASNIYHDDMLSDEVQSIMYSNVREMKLIFEAVRDNQSHKQLEALSNILIKTMKNAKEIIYSLTDDEASLGIDSEHVVTAFYLINLGDMTFKDAREFSNDEIKNTFATIITLGLEGYSITPEKVEMMSVEKIQDTIEWLLSHPTS